MKASQSTDREGQAPGGGMVGEGGGCPRALSSIPTSWMEGRDIELILSYLDHLHLIH